MVAQKGIKGALRGRGFIWLSLLFFLIASHRAAAQQIGVRTHGLYVQGDTLKLDIHLDNLFTPRILEAIESGMTTSIVLEFRLEPQPGSSLVDRVLLIRLDHDIWEGTYRVTRHATASDTLYSADFETAKRLCSNLTGVPLAASLPQEKMFVLYARVKVDPISPEQQERTRKWLNLLSKGSLLELFISLDRPYAGTRWTEIQRFAVGDLFRASSENPK